MKAIYKKEMLQYFRTVIGYVFLAIFVFINTYYFLVQNLLTRSGNIAAYFQSTVLLEMFLMPMLTMRSFSEEKKQKTDILLYTMPVSRIQIVAGKFLAAESVFLTGLLFTLPFPFILAACGSSQPWITAGNYLGIILMMSAFIAIGMFVSALTENQIVAAVITYVIIFMLWFSYGLISGVQSELLQTLLLRLSMMRIYYEMIIGILDPAGITLNLALIFIFLFLTTMVIHRKRG